VLKQGSAPEVQWDEFHTWLAAQYSSKHTYAVMSYAQKYHEAIWQPAKAAALLAMTPDTRRYVMESLAALSKFTGTYEQWQAIKKQTGLKWQSSNKSVNLVKALLNDEIADIIPWLKDVTTKVSRKFSAVLIFAALTGLRPSEACNAVNLITELHQKGQLSEYYDEELNLLLHFKYPAIFLRRCKNAYISFASPSLIQAVIGGEPVHYYGMYTMLNKQHLFVRANQLRKNYATMMRKSLEREMIDLVQGRVDGSVFVRHYYRPLIKELRDRVLAGTAELEKELLPLLEPPTRLSS